MLVIFLLAGERVRGQGEMNFTNILPGGADVRTRVGSIDGPLAGTDYSAILLAGPTPDSLTPVGPSVRHLAVGLFSGGTRRIPGIPAGEQAFTQVAAWNGEVWGDEFTLVPRDQIGFSDTAEIVLDVVASTRPVPTMRITRPPVVPIPEPSSCALFVVGCALLLFRGGRKQLDADF